MKDFATSSDPAVQTQLDRLTKLTLPQGRFGLETIRALLERLGNPQDRLPPAFHVAGTNGKGSTCAYLENIIDRAGYKVGCYTSPHLLAYNERVRVNGQPASDLLVTDGPRATIRYAMKGGLQVRQQLALQTDGRTLLNHLEVRKWGVRVARVEETIRPLP